MKKIFNVTLFLGASLIAAQAYATDLVTVYQQALANDPTFKAQNALWLAERETLPINRANLMPQLSATAGLNRMYNNFDSKEFSTNKKFYSNEASYSLSLTQPIFNYANWASVWSAGATVKQAQANFSNAAQDLILRTANAYFAVLEANDILRVKQAKKKSIGKNLEQTRQRFKVGLIPITDVNDAQAKYDATIAEEISAQSDLDNRKEQLREITGIKYDALKGLGAEVPLVRPNPENIEQWARIAERQNYQLLAARYAAIAARENIEVKNAGHLPTFNVVGSYGYDYNNNSNVDPDVGSSMGFSRNKSASLGLSVEVPIFSGGGVTAQARQAHYYYQQAVATQEQTYRGVVSQTRQAYLGVVSGISKIVADRQEVKSKQSALRSERLSYSAGMRTMVDVLQAETDLYNAQETYMVDQYAYITQTLNLKKLAGLLRVRDIEVINSWLQKSTILSSFEDIVNKSRISAVKQKLVEDMNHSDGEVIPRSKIDMVPQQNGVDKTSDTAKPNEATEPSIPAKPIAVEQSTTNVVESQSEVDLTRNASQLVTPDAQVTQSSNSAAATSSNQTPQG